MNVSGMASKIASHAEAIGALWTLADPVRLDGLISSIQQMTAGVVHAPLSLPTEIQTWFSGEGKNTLTAYAAGWIIEMLGVPYVGKYGGAIQKAAMGYGLATLGNRILYSMTHSEIKGVNILNGSPSVQQNFANAPLVSQYTEY